MDGCAEGHAAVGGFDQECLRAALARSAERGFDLLLYEWGAGRAADEQDVIDLGE